MRTKTERFFAVVLVVGGVVGIAIAIVFGMQLFKQNWLLGCSMLLLLVLFAWVAFVGLRLWQGTPYGRRWAIILFATQIPVLAIPGFRYQWFTGAEFAPTLSSGSGSMTLGVHFNMGANGDFFFGGTVPQMILGINLFAILAVAMLVRSKRSIKKHDSLPAS
ncbi:MAG: hypothetical protein ACREPP_03230 [Rhodanobacteraceae bacterium]